MDFSLEYTKEQKEFAREVREWLEKNIPGNLATVRDPVKMNREQWQIRREFVRKLGQKGWLYPGYPREYGGGGLDSDHCYVLSVELAEKGLGVPTLYDVGVLAGPTVLACGTEQQKKRLLPPMFQGEVLTWQLFTEPEAGTDAANQQTNALRSVREDDHFIINGHKIFTGSFPSQPEQLYVLTRSDLDAPRHRNLTSFLIPADMPGITVQPLDLFILTTPPAATGPTGANMEGIKHTVFFDDVKVPEEYMIGKEGEGWKVTIATLDVEHSGGFGGATGNYVVEEFLSQCRNNPNILNRLRENPQLLDCVVELYMGEQIDRLWTLRNACGMGGAHAGPQLALFGKFFGKRLAPLMANVLGPYSFTDDEQWGMGNGIFDVGQRCAVALAPGGTPEALKIGIARALAVGR